jgi:hypothetical protein
MQNLSMGLNNLTVSESPLIKDGVMYIDDEGQLVTAPDIETQVYVTALSYDSVASTFSESLLIPYLESTHYSEWNKNTITQILKSAFQPLLYINAIQNIEIKVPVLKGNILYITIDVLDSQNQSVTFSWSNIQD